MIELRLARCALPMTMLSLCALALCLWHLGSGLWIAAKARLAQHLIEQAWQQTLGEPGHAHKPWSWADTWPVLHLQTLQRDGWHDSYVLQSASGESLAFGPGFME